ncbi:N-acetylmuramoyl-L-alanine amidase [Streptomyces sp. NPDC017448]|uniref:peptidoglycan recognition protein family protein n=1 Tax=Streptomyces sp. NPDC017448 TaxID=3364996 RepID=UPI003792B7B4
MATPLNANQQLIAFKAEGCNIVERPGWRNNNRNHKGPWGPVHGVMIHHTVTSGTESSVELCYNGHSTLPGPLCHTVGAKDGALYMVGNGRANHAGMGDGDVLKAVIAEHQLPPDNEADTDGNRYFYGIELINRGDGKDPWPEAQLESAARWAAALCRAHGWSARSVIAHKEWQPGKIDPTFDMDKFRARVQEILDAAKPSKPAKPAPAPKPKPKPVVSLARLIKAAQTDPPKSGTPVSYAATRIVEDALVKEGLLKKAYADGHYGQNTKSAMSAWQERCGFTGRKPGQGADGIPGKTSLTKLGAKYGFTVRA